MLILQFEEFPVLETDRLILRAIGPEDVDAMLRLRSNPEVMRYIARPLLRSRKEADDLVQHYIFLFEQKLSITWAISLRETPGMIGSIGFPRINRDNYRGEIGYSLDPDHWKKGYMDEAIKKIIDFGFKKIGFHSMEAVIHPDNGGSAGLVKKHGFVQEGYFRERTLFEGTWLDERVFSLLARDWA